MITFVVDYYSAQYLSPAISFYLLSLRFTPKKKKIVSERNMLHGRAESKKQSLCRPATATALGNCTLRDPGEERSPGTATRVVQLKRFMILDSLPARRQTFL